MTSASKPCAAARLSRPCWAARATTKSSGFDVLLARHASHQLNSMIRSRTVRDRQEPVWLFIGIMQLDTVQLYLVSEYHLARWDGTHTMCKKLLTVSASGAAYPSYGFNDFLAGPTKL